MAKNKWFGTDGIRGVANEFPMTPEFVSKLAMAVAELVCLDKKKVAIAKDTRISCDMLEAALISGFTAKGVDVIRLGVLPTPAVTTFVSELEVDVALMITASHNPYHDNGIKFITKGGDKFDDDIAEAIENLIEDDNFKFDKDKVGEIYNDYSIKDKYIKSAYKKFAQISLEGLKIVVDCANGVFYDILPKVLRKFGAEVFELGVEPDGFNINRDCGSQHPQKMSDMVKSKKADLGIAVDGDGDRVKIADDKGRLIKGEQLMAFLAKFLEENGENKGRPIASTKLSNTALERYVVDVLNLEYLSTDVGERPIIKILKKKGGIFGGEESGHILLLDYAKSGDAMMTALKVLQGLSRFGKKASKIFPLFKEDFTYFENYSVSSAAKVKKITRKTELKELLAELSNKIAGHGRVVIHPSGTEPKIRIWVCGDDEAMVNGFGQQLWDLIEKLSAES